MEYNLASENEYPAKGTRIIYDVELEEEIQESEEIKDIDNQDKNEKQQPELAEKKKWTMGGFYSSMTSSTGESTLHVYGNLHAPQGSDGEFIPLQEDKKHYAMFVLGSTQPGVDTEWFVTGPKIHNEAIQSKHTQKYTEQKVLDLFIENKMNQMKDQVFSSDQKTVRKSNDSKVQIKQRLKQTDVDFKEKKARQWKKFFYKDNDGWIESLDIKTVHERNWEDTLKATKVAQKDWQVQAHLPALKHGYLAWGGYRSYEPANLMHMKLADPHFNVYFQFYSEQDGKVTTGKSKLELLHLTNSKQQPLPKVLTVIEETDFSILWILLLTFLAVTLIGFIFFCLKKKRQCFWKVNKIHIVDLKEEVKPEPKQEQPIEIKQTIEDQNEETERKLEPSGIKDDDELNLETIQDSLNCSFEKVEIPNRASLQTVVEQFKPTEEEKMRVKIAIKNNLQTRFKKPVVIKKIPTKGEKIAKIIENLPEIKVKSKTITYPTITKRKTIVPEEKHNKKSMREQIIENMARRRAQMTENSTARALSTDSFGSWYEHQTPVPTKPSFDILPRQKPLISINMRTSHPSIIQKSKAIFHNSVKKETFLSKTVQQVTRSMDEHDFDKIHQVYDGQEHKPCIYNAISRAVKHLLKTGTANNSYDLDQIVSTVVTMRHMENQASICLTNSVDLSAMNGDLGVGCNQSIHTQDQADAGFIGHQTFAQINRQGNTAVPRSRLSMTKRADSLDGSSIASSSPYKQMTLQKQKQVRGGSRDSVKEKYNDFINELL